MPGMGGLPASLVGVSGLISQSNKLNLTRKGGAAQFVFAALQYGSGGGLNVFFGGGARKGDLAVIVFNNSLTAIPAVSGWTLAGQVTWNAYGYNDGVIYKVLDDTDIANNFVNVSATGSDAFVAVMIYRGPTKAAIAGAGWGQDGGSPAAPVISGFVPAQGSKRIITYCASRNQAAVLLSPSGVTNRIPCETSGASRNFSAIYDDLPSAAYSGGPLVYTGTGATMTIDCAIELT